MKVTPTHQWRNPEWISNTELRVGSLTIAA